MSPTDVLLTVLTASSIAPAVCLLIFSFIKAVSESERIEKHERYRNRAVDPVVRSGDPARLRRFAICIFTSTSAAVLASILTTLAAQEGLEPLARALVIAFTVLVYGIVAYTAHLLFEIPKFRDRIREAVLAEREECAKLVDRFRREGVIPGQRNDQVYREQAYRTISEELAGKIRARE